VGKEYDRSYFDRWYRDPARRIASRAALRRKVAMAVAVTEHFLGRPVRTVLDVGCGEAAWRAPLRALRPGIAYLGLDPSAYAVRRFGRSRGVRAGSLHELVALRFERPFDLVVCADVLHYVPASEVSRGLEALAALCGGVACLEVMTREDDPEGDLRGFLRRPADWYRRRFARAGFAACGPQLYLAPGLSGAASAMERPGRDASRASRR
jgi:SAM-dependent methyltransferase